MKRIIGAVVGAVVLSAVAFLPFGSAGAAPNQTEHFKFHGDVAEAAWSRGSVDTFVGVQNTKTGTELFLDQTTSTSTGFTDLFVDVSSGFTFTIASKLTNASLTATNVSATRCTFDNDFNEIGCNATT